ncbi:ABC transporter permease [Pseudomonas sp. NEEL19]|uniref:ABC transporter permease n=1 Tax=Pseudomonas sp. NEEL19 TaxID=2867409 RepID=UPI002367CED8|nr:ABC transporter permease [Pseudomonas sp. NEEL19]WDM60957.1 ABC transporter permease [Pseudomonas sp. NEEL19]
MTSSSLRPLPRTIKLYNISKILIKEHLREPSSLLWTAFAPCMLFFIMSPSDLNPDKTAQPYLSYAGWFYAYISANVAFFGFSFYLIGRRESGFIRSFIYQKDSIRLFLMSHMISYSILSVTYASLFYLITKPIHGDYSAQEYLYTIACFFTSYLGFSCVGLVMAALPIKFGTASTLFSLLSFLMLMSSYLGAVTGKEHDQLSALINPLYLSTRVFRGELPLLSVFPVALFLPLLGLYLTANHFRVQPIWSRY